MSQFTRREALRRSVFPLVAVTGTGGLAAAIAGAETQSSGAEVAFATVLAASESSLTVARERGSALSIPIGRIGGAPPRPSNPFRVGESVVLDLDKQGAVVGVEPLSDFVSGVVERRDGNRLSVAGATFVIDEWSLARVSEGGDAAVVPLRNATTASGTEVSLLVRRGPDRAARRIAAAFIGSQHGDAAAAGAGG